MNANIVICGLRRPRIGLPSALDFPYPTIHRVIAGTALDAVGGLTHIRSALWSLGLGSEDIMRTLMRDGISLAYQESGSGEPPFLFVHGWACDHTYFAPQVDRFSRDHRTVAVDLRGHGASDKPHQEYTIDGFADDLAWLCEELKLEKPVVIGHSMGGLASLVLAARHPSLPAAIVMADGAIGALLGPLSASDPRSEEIQGLRGSDYREVARRFIGRMFLASDDPQRRARIVDQMTSVPQHVLASAFEHIWTYDDLARAASACKVPALYIQAARPKPEVARLQELCPLVVVGRTVGAGHFNQLEVPDQVNAMIERFLAVSDLTPR
jgi:pimeloyl-ACP methyl ester carboxylesterase